MERAEKAGDEKRVKTLLVTFNNLSKKLLEFDREPASSNKLAA